MNFQVLWNWLGQKSPASNREILCMDGTTTGLKNGAYAEYVCVPEHWKNGVIKIKPEFLSHAEAAALPVGGMTALQLVRKARVEKGDRCLIYGASGSVGTYTVQLAKYSGAEVTAVCSRSNVNLVTSIGADAVRDYAKKDFLHSPTKFNPVIDAVGKLSKADAARLLNADGKFISVKTLTDEKTEYLELLEKVVSDGKLKVIIDRRYLLKDISKAHAYV
ncbi:MAG TPA: NAD(P)-dependent alcohol dehydrogenase, partial [Chryseosolibacter sp.]